MKPLTIKQRQISRAILFVIFLICAPIIILYSFGYRLDTGLSFQKTGGIFVHSNIPSASVFIDEEFVKNNGLFLRNMLIQDLTPNKSYTVRFQKDGLQSWVKKLEVYPSLVTEGRVLMLPNAYAVREILPYINTQNIATTTPSVKGAKANNPEYVSLFELFSTSTKEIIPKATNTTIMTATPTIETSKTKLELFLESIGIEDQSKLANLIISGKEVSWLTKEGIILYWIDSETNAPYYYCSGAEKECVNMLTLPWNDIKQFDYFPGRSDVWIVLTSNGIYAVEIDNRSQRNIQTIYEGQNLTFKLAQDGRLIIKQNSSLFEINL